MSGRILGVFCVGLVLLFGCYQAHGGREGEREPDAGLPADAAVPETRDSGPSADHDAGPPLPAEPDPDLGPDARPSDYPGADDWEDPPEVGEEDPCCVLGDPVLITSRDLGMALGHEPPLIAWGPGVWGLLVTRNFLRAAPDLERSAQVFLLSANGESLGEPIVLEMPVPAAEDSSAQALRYAEGRWAAAVSGAWVEGNFHNMHARLFDRDLRPASDWLPIGVARSSLVDLARLSHGDRWLGIGSTDDMLLVGPFEDLGVDRPAVHPLTEPTSLDSVGLRSRVAVLLGQSDERPARNELAVLGPGPGYPIVGRVQLRTRYGPGASASLAVLRDLVVAIGTEDRRVTVEVVDPFELEQVAGPQELAEIPIGEDRGVRNAVSVAGSSKLGLAGVCYGIPGDGLGRGDESRIEFRLVGPDAVPRGAAVTVVESHFRGGLVNCYVGGDGLGFLVGWWDGSELWVRRVDVVR